MYHGLPGHVHVDVETPEVRQQHIRKEHYRPTQTWTVNYIVTDPIRHDKKKQNGYEYEETTKAMQSKKFITEIDNVL